MLKVSPWVVLHVHRLGCVKCASWVVLKVFPWVVFNGHRLGRVKGVSLGRVQCVSSNHVNGRYKPVSSVSHIVCRHVKSSTHH